MHSQILSTPIPVISTQSGVLQSREFFFNPTSDQALMLQESWQQILSYGIHHGILQDSQTSLFAGVRWLSVSDDGCAHLMFNGEDQSLQARIQICGIILMIANSIGLPVLVDRFELHHPNDLNTVVQDSDVSFSTALRFINRALVSHYATNYLRVADDPLFDQLVSAATVWHKQVFPWSPGISQELVTANGPDTDGCFETFIDEADGKLMIWDSSWLTVVTHADDFVNIDDQFCSSLAIHLIESVNSGKSVLIAGKSDTDELVKNNQLWASLFHNTECVDWLQSSYDANSSSLSSNENAFKYTQPIIQPDTKNNDQDSVPELKLSDEGPYVMSTQPKPNTESSDEANSFKFADITELAAVALNVRESDLLGLNKNCQADHNSRRLLSFCFLRMGFREVAEFAEYMGYENTPSLENDAKMAEQSLTQDRNAVSICRQLLEALSRLHLHYLNSDDCLASESGAINLEDYDNVVLFPVTESRQNSLLRDAGLTGRFLS